MDKTGTHRSREEFRRAGAGQCYVELRERKGSMEGKILLVEQMRVVEVSEACFERIE